MDAQRPPVAAAACAAPACAADTIVIIGDTPLDGEAAAAVGFQFIGVATGIFDAETLRHAGARIVINDLVSGIDTLEAALTELRG